MAANECQIKRYQNLVVKCKNENHVDAATKGEGGRQRSDAFSFSVETIEIRRRNSIERAQKTQVLLRGEESLLTVTSA